ncbi:hypothetical protein RclHR1_10470011 [Rhizophagus clarus]|uniref:Uncharacterized protein n=1 Tax=Rhizophagus clarus TaxID=94130 RepID=A0A2Z6QU31_9GLOM|nr:hypothetical protein RclHR1_10470011 [Rhizophagus clarus]GES93118.1 hypothetical protein RCL_e4602_RclHR1_10470011 [Rhizophagus clarus]
MLSLYRSSYLTSPPICPKTRKRKLKAKFIKSKIFLRKRLNQIIEWINVLRLTNQNSVCPAVIKIIAVSFGGDELSNYSLR